MQLDSAVPGDKRKIEHDIAVEYYVNKISGELARKGARGGPAEMKPRLLRLFLFIAAVGWGFCAVGVFLPWHTAVLQLQDMGAGEIPADPMLDYWFRMAASTFTGIGVFFFVLALRPAKFANVIPLAGILMILEGIVLLVHGLRLGLAPFPFCADTAFCLLVGTGILLSRGGATTASGQAPGAAGAANNQDER